MAYHVRKEQSVENEIRRLACERIDKAMVALQRASQGWAEGVHRARKRFKEMRALLRLVRRPLGHCYATESHFYRDAGRKLAPFRDTRVLVESWTGLCKRFPDLTTNQTVCDLQERFVAKFEAIHTEEADSIPKLLGSLSAARLRVNDWPLDAVSFDELLPGLRRTYSCARRSVVDACNNSDDASLIHECRKRTKDYWCHTTLLEPTCPRVMRSKCRQLKRLLDLLGQDHDLVVLCTHISDELPASNVDLVHLLNERIRKVQGRLRTRACRLATSVYSESPKHYAHRVTDQWILWCHD